MKIRLISLVSAAFALTAAAFAQDTDRQGGPPPGSPPGMGFGMRGAGGLPPAGMLLRRKDVQDDLALTDSQKTQIDEIMQSMRPPGGRGGGPGGPGGPPPMEGGGDDGPMGPPPGGGGPGGPPPGGDPGGPPPDGGLTVAISIQQPQGGPGGPGGRGGFEAMQKKMEAKLNAVLTDPQRTRLHEIAIQVAGNSAVTDADVQKSLALTSEQKAKIKDLVGKQRDANREIFQKVQSGDMDREEVRPLMKKNNEILKTELGKVLTDAQRDKLAKLGGKTFTANEEERG